MKKYSSSDISYLLRAMTMLEPGYGEVLISNLAKSFYSMSMPTVYAITCIILIIFYLICDGNLDFR